MIYGQIILIALLTWLTFWRRDIFFYIVDGIALIVFGLEWRGYFNTNGGLAMSLVIIATGLYCLILAIVNIVRK